MILYRAMCEPEAVDTIRGGRPSFLRRYKFFSPLESFVHERVQDGEFNNSRFKPTRYTHLLAFEVRSADVQWFTKSAREWKLDRRCEQNVHWVRIILLSAKET